MFRLRYDSPLGLGETVEVGDPEPSATGQMAEELEVSLGRTEVSDVASEKVEDPDHL